jgi:hypothetical protein
MAGVTAGDAMPAWRNDIDALAFGPEGHAGICTVHRLAFRTLLGRLPAPEDCIAFFRANEAAFQAAAGAKIARRGLAAGANFHLTSRDVAAAIGVAK